VVTIPVSILTAEVPMQVVTAQAMITTLPANEQLIIKN